MGLKDRDYYWDHIKKLEDEAKGQKTRAERERSYYYPSAKEDRSPDWPKTRRKPKWSRWVAGGSLLAALALTGKALIATNLPMPQIDALKQPTHRTAPAPPPQQTMTTTETTARPPSPPPPATTRTAPPVASAATQSAPRPAQPAQPARPNTPRRTLQECMAPGSNEVNTKVLACMNGQ